MSQKPRDDEALVEFLARRDALSRRYQEASAEQPSADVDQAVLAAAHRAAGARPQAAGRRPRRWATRWGAPLAAAAVVVLAVAITVMLEREPAVMEMGETARQAPAATAPPSEPAAQEGKTAPLAVAPAAKQRSAPAQAIREEKKTLADNAYEQLPKSPVAEKEATGTVTADIAAGAAMHSDELAKSEAAPAPAAELSASPRAAAERADQASAPQPQLRIAEIEALYREGQTETADRALTAFCRDFPDYKLSDELAGKARRLGLVCAPSK